MFSSDRVIIVWRSEHYLKGSSSHLDQAAVCLFRRREGLLSMNIKPSTEWGCRLLVLQQRPAAKATVAGFREAPASVTIPNESKAQWGSQENKGRLIVTAHSAPFLFFWGKKSIIYCSSLLNLMRVQEDREPEDLHLNGFLKGAVSKIFVPGKHWLASLSTLQAILSCD